MIVLYGIFSGILLLKWVKAILNWDIGLSSRLLWLSGSPSNGFGAIFLKVLSRSLNGGKKNLI